MSPDLFQRKSLFNRAGFFAFILATESVLANTVVWCYIAPVFWKRDNIFFDRDMVGERLLRSTSVIRRLRIASFVISVFVSCGIPISVLPQTSTTNLSPREIAKRSLPSVVLLIMENSHDETGKTGSGFFVAQDIIATNFHVIRNSDQGVVKIVGQETLYAILGVVGVDQTNDLALLKVARIRGTPLQLNYDDLVAIGDEVFTVGNPHGLEGTFSQGIVSSIRKSSKRELVQITAAISEGSSGGAVLNSRGEVVGVAVGAIEGGQSLNFAIPVSLLRSLISNQKPLVALARVTRSTEAGFKALPLKVRSPIGTLPTRSVPRGRSRMPFKAPDLVDENLFGRVEMTSEVVYVPERVFDEWLLGDEVGTSVHKYNLDGYKEFRIDTIYSEKGIGGGQDFGLFLLADKKKFPVSGKHLYLYEYSIGRITKEMYLKCAGCASFELDNKIVIKCEENIETRFFPDGKMFLKKIIQREKDGSTTEDWYNGDGTIWSKEITYRDKSSEVKEYWRPTEANKAILELKSKMLTTETKGQILQNYVCIKEKQPCNSLTILAKGSRLILRREYEAKVLKYDYQFDSIGNWIKQTEYQQVKKFGRSYFEPTKMIIRSVKYY